MAKRKTPFSLKVRSIHRYLGFFLAGIMAVYAISGIVMVYRNTDFLKHEVITEKQMEPKLTSSELSSKLRKNPKVTKTEGAVFYFKGGSYNQDTGIVTTRKMELPFILDKMEHLHKATTKSPVYFLNIFFGASLLFFVVSAFWMYTPKMPIFRKGILFAIGGFILTIILLFI
ncbi:PepSY domain-containing protein [uncultured Dokdonia sp.]|uniref:PepSY domain-containing protein n=1 Tax=Dokdonia sp. Asnod2-E02 TaxID=3160574 RepID=UPI00261556E0|nr:PepSY domain-containing protein [uncultured Dokdonia sp.]